MARARSLLSLPELLTTEEMPVHPLPDEPRKRGWPFGASTALHALAVLVLLGQYLSNRDVSSPHQPDLTIAFQEPQPQEPRAPAPPIPPAPRAPEHAKPAPALPREAERQPIAPPPVPKQIPPPVPLPQPTRMGQQVPIPHIPVPGTVPPEVGKTGKPGPPAPEVPKERDRIAGDPLGENDTDPGAGPGQGPGAGEGVGPAAQKGTGQVLGGKSGSLTVPRLKGGLSEREGAPGGGRRRGLNLVLPPDNGAFGDFDFEDKDYDWSDYWSQMYWAIWRAWMRRLFVSFQAFERWAPSTRTQIWKGTVLIRFVIERNGSVSSIDVLEPSSLPPLDASAQDALKEVILPRLPDDFPKDREGVTGRFTMDIEGIPGWKEQMKYLKESGTF